MKNKSILYFLILFSLVIHAEWLTGWTFGSGDWWYFFSENLKIWPYKHVWINVFDFGYTSLTLWRLPSEFLYWISLSSQVGDKLWAFLPYIIITPVSVYLFLSSYFKTTSVKIIGGVFFISNSYFLAINSQGHIPLVIASCLMLIGFVFFKKCTDTDRFLYLNLSILFLFLTGIYDFRFVYIGLIMFGIYFLFNLTKKSAKKNVLYLIYLVIIILLLNIFWILPSFLTGFRGGVGRILFGKEFWSLTSGLTLHYPFWPSSGNIEWFKIQPIPIFYWFFPLLSFSSLVFNKFNKNIIFYSFISILGIFLLKMNNPPFGIIYEWLYEYLPGFNAFREPTKFFIFVIIGYTFLITSFFEYLHNLFFYKRKIIYYLSVSVFFVFCILINIPVITKEIGGMYASKEIASDYDIVAKQISEEDEFFRTLWIPNTSMWSYYDNNHPQISGRSFYQEIIVPNKFNLNKYNELIDLLERKTSNQFFDDSSIKYVIVPIQEKVKDDDLFVYYGGRENPDIRQWYIDELDKISFLEKIDIGTTDIVIYENKDFKPHIFSFDTLFNITTNQNIEDKYSFITEDLGKEFYFTFDNSESNLNTRIKIQNIFDRVTLNNLDSINRSIKVENSFKENQKNNIIYIKNNSLEGNIVFQNNNYIYEDKSYQLENIVQNYSFEEGFWQEKVGDCNNYDNNGILGMSLNTEEKSDGNQSLQLEATNHIACTSIKVKLESGSSYLFSFDYQSTNSNIASYYIRFNHPAKTFLSEELQISNKSWNTFSRIINVPEGVTSADLYVYADSTDGKTNIINRYDNFNLIEIPDLKDEYYLVSEQVTELKEPKKISFDIVNPTKKLIYVEGATTSFYLAMGESYHLQWQLQFNNGKVNGFLNSWIPFVKPDRISYEYHYKLNDFLNAWYVDTETYCVQNKNLCTQNADGSYDMEMVIEFFPQRWFYLGLLISGTTLLGCLGYFGYAGVKTIKRKLKKKNEKIN
jgi:hypothetical protein